MAGQRGDDRGARPRRRAARSRLNSSRIAQAINICARRRGGSQNAFASGDRIGTDESEILVPARSVARRAAADWGIDGATSKQRATSARAFGVPAGPSHDRRGAMKQLESRVSVDPCKRNVASISSKSNIHNA